ncbi:MAG: hypothetical protein ACRD43_12640 [Pyrinomonadaceae bacterium]
MVPDEWIVEERVSVRNMTDSWQSVRGKPQKVTRRPRLYVSLNRRGEIAMNDAAWGEVRRPYNVALLYDAKHQRIGIKFPVRTDSRFFPVRNYGRNGRTRVVRAARLLKQFGIEVEETIVFRDPETTTYEGEPMLAVNLDDATARRKRRRF